LDTASVVASGGVAQLRVIGITPGPDNAWGDAYTIVQVQISEHQDVATINAY
jgi:predicted aconitase